MVTKVENLVVGAGPTGLAAALTLAQAGREVRVVDGAAQGANTSRAAVVHARTLETFESLGLSEAVVRQAVHVRYFDIADGRHRLGRVDLGRLPGRYPFAAMISQADTERLLRTALAEAGVTVEWNTRVLDVHRPAGDGPVAVSLDGAAEVSAARVLAADGMHSTVRDAVGIGFPGSAYPASFVLADMEFDSAVPRNAVSLTFDPDGLVVLVPLPGDGRRFRLVAGQDDPAERPTRADIQAVVDSRLADGTVTGVLWSGRFRVHHRLAASYRAGSVFLAGDAAHVHSPAGGQGMNTGIQDAVTWARLVVAGTDLDEYEPRRRPVAAKVLRMTNVMTLAATRRALPARLARDAGVRVATRVPTLRQRIALAMAELDVPPVPA